VRSRTNCKRRVAVVYAGQADQSADTGFNVVYAAELAEPSKMKKKHVDVIMSLQRCADACSMNYRVKCRHSVV